MLHSNPRSPVVSDIKMYRARIRSLLRVSSFVVSFSGGIKAQVSWLFNFVSECTLKSTAYVMFECALKLNTVYY